MLTKQKVPELLRTRWTQSTRALRTVNKMSIQNGKTHCIMMRFRREDNGSEWASWKLLPTVYMAAGIWAYCRPTLDFRCHENLFATTFWWRNRIIDKALEALPKNIKLQKFIKMKKKLSRGFQTLRWERWTKIQHRLHQCQHSYSHNLKPKYLECGSSREPIHPQPPQWFHAQWEGTDHPR